MDIIMMLMIVLTNVHNVIKVVKLVLDQIQINVWIAYQEII